MTLIVCWFYMQCTPSTFSMFGLWRRYGLWGPARNTLLSDTEVSTPVATDAYARRQYVWCQRHTLWRMLASERYRHWWTLTNFGASDTNFDGLWCQEYNLWQTLVSELQPVTNFATKCDEIGLHDLTCKIPTWNIHFQTWPSALKVHFFKLEYNFPQTVFTVGVRRCIFCIR